ncbi:hypothetical protein HAX54_025341, partial [Datura stramonium]|nr:hypothetical protein [Datura stramonium]
EESGGSLFDIFRLEKRSKIRDRTDLAGKCENFVKSTLPRRNVDCFAEICLEIGATSTGRLEIEGRVLLAKEACREVIQGGLTCQHMSRSCRNLRSSSRRVRVHEMADGAGASWVLFVSVFRFL